MAYVVGAVLALAVGLFGTTTGLDRERGFYTTITIVIAFLYSLFAVMGGSPATLGADTGEIDAWRAGTTAIFDQRFWDEKRGFYYDYDARCPART